MQVNRHELPINIRSPLVNTRAAKSRKARHTTRKAGLPSSAWLVIRDHLPTELQAKAPNTPLGRKLEDLPPLRPLEFNANRRRGTFAAKKLIDIAAAMVFVTGKKASLPCGKCAAGDGVFSQCIIVPEPAYDEVSGACANCIYQGRTKQCSRRLQFQTSKYSCKYSFYSTQLTSVSLIRFSYDAAVQT
jgi:hypothetical protein